MNEDFQTVLAASNQERLDLYLGTNLWSTSD
jgi:hypothetical protein